MRRVENYGERHSRWSTLLSFRPQWPSQVQPLTRSGNKELSFSCGTAKCPAESGGKSGEHSVKSGVFWRLWGSGSGETDVSEGQKEDKQGSPIGYKARKDNSCRKGCKRCGNNPHLCCLLLFLLLCLAALFWGRTDHPRTIPQFPHSGDTPSWGKMEQMEQIWRRSLFPTAWGMVRAGLGGTSITHIKHLLSTPF